jgi:hypothetical protein
MKEEVTDPSFTPLPPSLLPPTHMPSLPSLPIVSTHPPQLAQAILQHQSVLDAIHLELAQEKSIDPSHLQEEDETVEPVEQKHVTWDVEELPESSSPSPPPLSTLLNRRRPSQLMPIDENKVTEELEKLERIEFILEAADKMTKDLANLKRQLCKINWVEDR